MKDRNVHMRRLTVIFIIASIALSCEAPSDGPSDSSAPNPGDGGTLTFTDQTATSLTLNWTQADDETTARGSLEYRAVISVSADIATVDEAGSPAATVVLDWTAGTTSTPVSGLVTHAAYYFNVLVRDSEGNTAAYAMTPVLMNDPDAPSPGGSGTITTLYPKATTQLVRWQKATDAADPQSVLEYKLVRSIDPDIDSVGAIELGSRGSVVMDWTDDIGLFADSGLTGNTGYYYNVLVRDTGNHMAAYAMTLIRTPYAPEDVFSFAPGETLAEKGFTLVDYMEPANANGDLVTSTAGLNQGTSYISRFTTPVFSDMDRNVGGGITVEWKIKFLASRWSYGYAEYNKFYVRLLDSSGTVLYSILWLPIPDEADRARFNRGLLRGTTWLNTNYQEQVIYPTGLNTPKWVSYRADFTSSGITIRNDLTADYTTTDGSPDWSAITTPQIESTDTVNNHIAGIRFEYVHFGDYSIEIKGFTISQIP